MSAVRTLADFSEVDHDHPLSRRRVPVLKGPHCRWKYHVAVVIAEADSLWGAGLEPTEQESDQLAAYLEHRMDWYNHSYRAHVRAGAPYDVDGTVNTFTFRKCPLVGWQYNAATWSTHTWFPQMNIHPQRFESLEALLDHIYTFGDDKPTQGWLGFKASSSAFGGAS